MIPGTHLKFYTSVAKGSKRKVRKFWGLIPPFVKVTGENLVEGGGAFCAPILPPPPHPEWCWENLRLISNIMLRKLRLRKKNSFLIKKRNLVFLLKPAAKNMKNYLKLKNSEKKLFFSCNSEIKTLITTFLCIFEFIK